MPPTAAMDGDGAGFAGEQPIGAGEVVEIWHWVIFMGRRDWRVLSRVLPI